MRFAFLIVLVFISSEAENGEIPAYRVRRNTVKVPGGYVMVNMDRKLIKPEPGGSQAIHLHGRTYYFRSQDYVHRPHHHMCSHEVRLDDGDSRPFWKLWLDDRTRVSRVFFGCRNDESCCSVRCCRHNNPGPSQLVKRDSFCKDGVMLPIVQGILQRYHRDPMRAVEALNYYFTEMKSIQVARGHLRRHATEYRSFVIDKEWGANQLPSFLSQDQAECHVIHGRLTAWIFKV